MKTILGTAQFGLDYGISNTTGKLNSHHIENILNTAIRLGVNYLDTANVYGDAEEKLGKFSELTKQFKLITKTAHTKENLNIEDNIKFIHEELLLSLEKMKRENIDIFLFHNTSDILNESGSDFFNAMLEIKESELRKRIGASVYSVQELKRVIDNYSLDVIQLPLNVFNQNFLKLGILDELKDREVEIHVRSVFLQGLLLMETGELDDYFDSIKQLHSDYRDTLSINKLSPVQGALNFLKSVDQIDAVIFGVQDSKQLTEIINSLESNFIDMDYSDFCVDDELITNPSKWISNR